MHEKIIYPSVGNKASLVFWLYFNWLSNSSPGLTILLGKNDGNSDSNLWTILKKKKKNFCPTAEANCPTSFFIFPNFLLSTYNVAVLRTKQGTDIICTFRD